MALNVILICLTAISALNVLLVIDLYNRSARIATGLGQLSAASRKLAHLLHKVTEKSDAAS